MNSLHKFVEDDEMDSAILSVGIYEDADFVDFEFENFAPTAEDQDCLKYKLTLEMAKTLRDYLNFALKDEK